MYMYIVTNTHTQVVYMSHKKKTLHVVKHYTVHDFKLETLTNRSPFSRKLNKL